jgi:hypothetical protein
MILKKLANREKCKKLLSSTVRLRCVVDSEMERNEAVWVVNLRGLCRTFLHRRRDMCDLLPSLNLA